MSTDDLRRSASSTIGAFVRGETSLAQMTSALEYVVDMAEEQADPATRDLNYLWGQIEIINAIHLDGGALEPQLPQLRELLDRFMNALTRRSDGESRYSERIRGFDDVS